ncbi:MAG TPA: AAA family ATPase [Candidatus Limnocylindrales bacterium]|nr:AAA family ATPase [Candidatus Limnocylindrales bacterium]
MSLEIRVLGPLEVLVDGAPIRVDTRKALAILALLAVEGRSFARDELATLCWPESDDESARGALRRTLSVLRSALGGRWLRVDRSTVALVPGEDVAIDLATLERALASDARDRDVEALASAAAVARGPFLAGFSLRDSPDFDDWRATRASTVERRVVELLDRLGAAAEASGDLPLAADTASRLVELDPLDEAARRRLMTVLARAGDRAGAIREYRATVAVLERELGVSPLAETTALYDAIRDGRLAMDASASRGAPSAPGPDALPSASAQRDALPLVGRTAALTTLVAAHRAATPDGRIAVVRGEAGIGKSRIVDELLALTGDAGGHALVTRAFPAEGAIAYGAIVALLTEGLARPDAARRLEGVAGTALGEVSRLVPLPAGMRRVEYPSAPDSPAARGRLLDAIAVVIAALVAGGAPGLVVIEDAQWADDASREALRYLARRLAGRGLLLVLTWRPEDLEADGVAFAAAIESLPGAVVVDLDRLDDKDVAQLVAASPAPGRDWDPAVLAAESEGLPLYVVEAIAAGPSPDGEPPRGVRALLRERLASVGETAGQVLAAGAVIGRSFDLETVRIASGRSEEETVTSLEELVRRAIVRETPGAGAPTYDFAHARLRDGAYEDIGLARRRLLHRRVADALRAAGGRVDAGRAAEIATHEQAAGRDAAAAEAWLEAGLLARRVFAYREALADFEAALALGHPDVAGLQIAIGEVRTALGDYAGASTALEAAAAVAPPDALAGIELRLGRVHARRGDVATAASHLDAALEGLPDDGVRATALVERGAVALRAGQLDRAAALAAEATERGGGAPSPGALRLAGLVALERGDLASARASLEASLARATGAPGDPGPAIAARNGLALVEAAAGDRASAIALLEAALAEARGAGEPHLEAAIENNLADQLHAAGRLDEAIDHLKRAVTLFAEVGGRPGELEPEIWKLVAW